MKPRRAQRATAILALLLAAACAQAGKSEQNFGDGFITAYKAGYAELKAGRHTEALKEFRSAAEVAGRPIQVVDSARATARTVAQRLQQRRIAPSPAAGDAESLLELLVTDQPAGFQAVASRFLGGESSPIVRQVDIDPVGE